MVDDPIVAEVRKAGEELAKEAGYDVHRFFENLRIIAQEKYQDRLVRRTPRNLPPEKGSQGVNSHQKRGTDPMRG